MAINKILEESWRERPLLLINIENRIFGPPLRVRYSENFRHFYFHSKLIFSINKKFLILDGQNISTKTIGTKSLGGSKRMLTLKNKEIPTAPFH